MFHVSTKLPFTEGDTQQVTVFRMALGARGMRGENLDSGWCPPRARGPFSHFHNLEACLFNFVLLIKTCPTALSDRGCRSLAWVGGGTEFSGTPVTDGETVVKRLFPR